MHLDCVDLLENWRSSQKICNVAVHFSSRATPDIAVGERCDLQHEPELFLYDPNDPRAALAPFEQRLQSLELDPEHSAVLCRGSRLVDTINGTGGAVFKGRLADLAEFADAFRNDLPLGASLLGRIEADLAGHAWPESFEEDIDVDDRIALRAVLLELARSLPATTLPAKQWASEARAATNKAVMTLGSPGSASTRPYKPALSAGAGPFVVERLIAGRYATLRARTIHSVKGESYDATLTVAGTPSEFDNASDWLDDEDERRIAYVAFTRARAYAALALPDSCPVSTIDRYESCGFVRVS